VDRLSTVLPELIIAIFDHFALDLDHRFLPIVRPFLYAQRSNLYRHVSLHDSNLSKFCRTLSESNEDEIGSMVRELTVRELRSTFLGIKSGGLPLVDEALEIIIPKLTRLTVLDVADDLFSNSLLIYLSTSNSLFSSHVTSLTLDLPDTSQVHAILNLFPSVHHLSIVILDPPIGKRPKAETSVSILLPPRTLELLQITDRTFTSPALQTLISSVDSNSVSFGGVKLRSALKAIRNPICVKSLHLNNLGTQEPEDGPPLDDTLLKFDRLGYLELRGALALSATFFTKFFKRSTSLASLGMGPGFNLVGADLILACQTKPILLKLLALAVFDPDQLGEELEDSADCWPAECDEESAREIIRVFRKGGVEVLGSAVNYIDQMDALFTGSEDDHESEEDSVDKSDEEQD
jgi:hypothetical protein